jgi:hypothetical protein
VQRHLHTRQFVRLLPKIETQGWLRLGGVSGASSAFSASRAVTTRRMPGRSEGARLLCVFENEGE